MSGLRSASASPLDSRLHLHQSVQAVQRRCKCTSWTITAHPHHSITPPLHPHQPPAPTSSSGSTISHSAIRTIALSSRFTLHAPRPPLQAPSTILIPTVLMRANPRRQAVIALNTQGITMSVKALYLCLKLTEKLRRANQTENSEGRAFARPFIESGRAEAEDRAGGHLLGHSGTTGTSASRRTTNYEPRTRNHES